MIDRFVAADPPNMVGTPFGTEGQRTRHPAVHPFYGRAIAAPGHTVELVIDRPTGRVLTRAWWECSCGSRGRQTDPSYALYLAARHTGQQ